MHNDFNLYAVQKALRYTFKDETLIKTAFVHRSFEGNGELSNTSLVLLGKKLTDFVLCDHITARSPHISEKELAYQCSELLFALNAEKFIATNDLAQYIMLSKINEPIRNGATMAKELFFAICAAIYKDGGLPAFRSFIKPMLRNSDEHYKPKNEGQILTSEEQNDDSALHIRNERLLRPRKNASVSITKAETVNNTSVSTKPEPKVQSQNEDAPVEKKKDKVKKEKSLASLILRKKSEEPAPSEQNNGEMTENTQIKVQKTFIRDPFAPVRLSDELRNFKSKRERTQQTASPAHTENPAKNQTDNTASQNSDDANYKSLLQEYIQKNIRTASVPINYTSTHCDGMWKCEITVDGKKLVSGTGINKRDAEKNTAKNGYLALSDKNSSERKLIAALSGADFDENITVPGIDYVSKINQHFQKKDHLSATSLTYSKKHSGKAGQYLVCLLHDGQELGEGRGDSFKEAKNRAAQNACDKLGI